MVVISGFIIFRLLIGDYYEAFINTCIVLSLAIVMLYAFRQSDSNRAGILFIFVNMTACVATTAMFGSTGLFWAYLVLWVNFLMARKRIAFFANLALILGLFFTESLYDTQLESITFLVTSLLITVFSLVFVERLQHQQEELERLAMQDPLTKIGNRRMMQHEIAHVVALFRRNEQPATLVLIDLDHFKKVNDQQGHEAGDEILRQFADLMRSNIRQADGFYRYGGEEFVLLLPDHDEASGLGVAQMMHQRVSGKIEQNGWVLRFSAGVAALKPEESPEAWLMRADQALYQAKQTGRNRVIVWDNNMSTGRRELAVDQPVD